MKNITIQPFSASHIPAVVELQSVYANCYSDASVIPVEVYLSSAFEGNIFCAFYESGTLLGYAPLYPVLMPWVTIDLGPDILPIAFPYTV